MIEVVPEDDAPLLDRVVVGKIRLKFFKKVSNRDKKLDQGVCVKGDDATAWESSWMDSM